MLIKWKMQRHEAVKRRRVDYPSKKQTKRHKFMTMDQISNNLKILRPYNKNATFFCCIAAMVCQMKDSMPCCNLAKRLLYKHNSATSAREYGICNEYITIKFFEAETCSNVNRCGIFVDMERGYLWARPDGLVREEKVLWSILLDQKKTFCEVSSDNILELKMTHHYIYRERI
ncbi:hypothetical protein PR048_013159, partial [Dryococelus australis]